jgi:hypothetical protein
MKRKLGSLILFGVMAVVLVITYPMYKDKEFSIINKHSIHDSIVVYGNVHLLPTNLVPLAEQTERDDVVFAQAELYKNIPEEIILMEGLPYTGERYQAEELYLEAGAVTDAERERVDNYANLYDTGLRFIIEGKKHVYGAEDEELYQASMDSLEADINFAASAGFGQLNDLRSDKISQNAKNICRATKQKVAVIVGARHLSWFKNHGYQVQAVPSLNNKKD